MCACACTNVFRGMIGECSDPLTAIRVVLIPTRGDDCSLGARRRCQMASCTAGRPAAYRHTRTDAHTQQQPSKGKRNSGEIVKLPIPHQGRKTGVKLIPVFVHSKAVWLLCGADGQSCIMFYTKKHDFNTQCEQWLSSCCSINSSCMTTFKRR